MVFACVNCICTIIALTCVLPVYAHVYCLFMPCVLTVYALFRNVSERCPQKAPQRYKKVFEFANSFCIFFKKNYILCKNGVIWEVRLTIFCRYVNNHI